MRERRFVHWLAGSAILTLSCRTKAPPPSAKIASSASPSAARAVTGTHPAPSVLPGSPSPSPEPALPALRSADDARIIRFDESPKDPRNVPATGCDEALTLGRRAAHRGDWAGASLHFARAVGCEPSNAMARGEFGHAELKNGDPAAAIGVLREAEGLATDTAVQRAIAHNLAAAYEATNADELARRARRRAAARKDTAGQPEGTVCPVMIVPGDNIEQGTWLEAHAALAPWDDVKPGSPSDARKRCCWVQNLEQNPERAMVLGDCGGEPEWSVDTWISAFQQMSRHVWALSEERAAWSVAYPRGGTFCPAGTASSAASAAARRLGDFLIVEISTAVMQPVPDSAGTEDMPCVETSVSRSVDLFDTHLGRGFSLVALARDVRVELHPDAHAVALHGRFCDERIALTTIASVNR